MTTTSDSAIPFSKPDIGEEEIDAVIDALKSGWLSIGPRTQKFEEAVAKYVGAKHAVGVTSCTAAQHLALIASNIGPGDEVITTPFTFASTANTIMHVGAKPVFVDIDPATFNIDYSKITDAITNKTKAIVPVHYGGHPCDMDDINQIAQEYNLTVIEDAAHAIGAEYNGKKIGGLGNLTCFSFYATKNMTTGEGGMIVTDNDETADRLRVLRLHGMSKGAWKRYDGKSSWRYDILEAGWKYNMNDIQAAMGLPQLQKLDKFNARRAEIVAKYKEGLKGLDIRFQEIKPGVKHCHHLFPIILNSCSRDDFIEKMKEKGVSTSVHFQALHLMKFYADRFGYKKGDFPVTEEAAGKIVSLPLYSSMTEKDIARVIKAARDTLK